MQIIPIPCLSDNYAYLVVCPETNEAAVVDVSEAGPIRRAVDDAKMTLRGIWSTHHHWDHVGGNEDVKEHYRVDVSAHASDKGRVPGQTRYLESGETFELGSLVVEVHHIPGHTLGAIAYVVRDAAQRTQPAAVFTGDTLFVAGCGRLFEGTAEQMYHSLTWLASLEPSTRVYCGHEYTESNLRFAAHVDPGNPDIAVAQVRAKAERLAGRPTVPSTLEVEMRVNPFLRSDSIAIRQAVGVASNADATTAFAAIRKAKDEFR